MVWLRGFISNDQGPVSGARLILDVRTERSRHKRTFNANEDGSFQILSNFGKFELTTEYKCVTRTDVVEIKSIEPQNLTIVLPNENCEEKAAKEAAEWNICNPENSTGSEVSDSDKAEIINHVLEGLLDEISVQSTLVYGSQEISISTENIEPEWVRPITGIKINLLNNAEIKAKARKGGDVSYFLFEKWERQGNCISFAFVRSYEKGKNSKAFFLCGNGAYRKFWYRRTDGKWKRKEIGPFL